MSSPLSSNNKGMHQFQNKKIGTQVRMTEPVHDLLVTTRLATSILHKITAQPVVDSNRPGYVHTGSSIHEKFVAGLFKENNSSTKYSSCNL